MSSSRPLLELSTAELYALASEWIGRELPPLDAIENEDWGRDYLLQALSEVPAGLISQRGLTW